MKFKTHAVVEGCPELKIRAKSEPIAFEAGAEGSFKIAVGLVNARVQEIPVNLRIPFLRSGGGLREVASIGSFGVHVQPFEVAVEGFGVRFDGVLGREGLDCHLVGTVACKMEMDAAGTIPGKVAKASIELADEDDVELLES